jgi:hypothetical protein
MPFHSNFFFLSFDHYFSSTSTSNVFFPFSSVSSSNATSAIFAGLTPFASGPTTPMTRTMPTCTPCGPKMSASDCSRLRCAALTSDKGKMGT